MLAKRHIVLTFLLSSALATADFFLFQVQPRIAFFIHNTLALFIGVGLLFCSFTLARKKVNKYVVYTSMIVGIAMMIIHLVKLLMGNCI